MPNRATAVNPLNEHVAPVGREPHVLVLIPQCVFDMARQTPTLAYRAAATAAELWRGLCIVIAAS